MGQQEVTGSISGFVFDPAGLPVAGARIVASDPLRGTKRTAFTNRAGFYRLAGLSPAEYDVRASAAQLRASDSSRVSVGVDASVRVNFELRLRQVRQSVRVAASPKLVQSQTSDEGATMSASFIARMPLNRRDFLQLALLVPGVLPAVQDSKLSARGSFAMHASGGREEFNDYLLDGADNNDPYINRYVIEAPVDAIQEFKIETNAYSAEYGRNAGGQVNVITRRGTNQWHGTTYEYARNRALDARNFFDGSQKPEFVRNQFGASIGGPVIRNRSFFFANIDGLTERQGGSNLATVPTAAERKGNFTGSGVSVVDPLTGEVFPGDVIPASRISPLASKVLALFPMPSVLFLTLRYNV